MSGTEAGIIIVIAIVVAAILYVLHKRTSANAAVTSELTGAVKAVPSLVASHVELAVGSIKAKVDAATTVLRADIAKAVGGAPPAPAKAIPISGTTAEPTPVAAVAAIPAPAAPAASVAAVTPPAAVVPSHEVAPSAGGGGTETWPQLVSVDGIKVLAFEPINPLWRASLMAHVFIKGGAGYVNDPSNGGLCVPPQPRRTAAGYPLHYALGAGDAAVGAPLIVFGDMDFDTDAEVAAFLLNEPARIAAGTAAAETAANRILTGPVPASSLTVDDWKFAWRYSDTPGRGAWIAATLSGPWSEIRQQLSIYGNNPGLMRGFDATKYNGVLRQYAK